MEKISIKSLGPIQEANIKFGDLTLLVGPQASGKSIFLQMIKLICDRDYVGSTIQKYGYLWADKEQLFDLFLGEGMSKIWNAKTTVYFDSKKIGNRFFSIRSETDSPKESVFYIPAQRILCLQNGWPKPFSDFTNDDPFVLRDFSEYLRTIMESKLASNSFLWQMNEIHNYGFGEVFYNGKIIQDNSGKRKRFVQTIGNDKLPYMSWSSGQKEFMPLLAAVNYFAAGRKKESDPETIIIEEPEMGLHPNAIKMIIVDLLHLVSLGYKVIVSTHSPVFLEFAWAFKAMKESSLKEDVFYELFDLKKSKQSDKTFKNIFEKAINTYYFDRHNDHVIVRDISTLDAGSENEAISEWGGLSSFSSRASDMVLKAVINE